MDKTLVYMVFDKKKQQYWKSRTDRSVWDREHDAKNAWYTCRGNFGMNEIKKFKEQDRFCIHEAFVVFKKEKK